MAGSILIFSGFQRSGKTIMAVTIAENYYRKNVKVYTNMNGTHFIHVEKLTDIPVDNIPKVMLIDEIHFSLNSRNFKSQADYVYFLNTICKRNILLLGTTIHPDMIDINLRRQIHYFFISKKNDSYIFYKVIDVQNQRTKFITLKRNKELYDYVEYNSNDIPDIFDFNMKEYINHNINTIFIK